MRTHSCIDTVSVISCLMSCSLHKRGSMNSARARAHSSAKKSWIKSKIVCCLSKWEPREHLRRQKNCAEWRRGRQWVFAAQGPTEFCTQPSYLNMPDLPRDCICRPLCEIWRRDDSSRPRVERRHRRHRSLERPYARRTIELQALEIA